MWRVVHSVAAWTLLLVGARFAQAGAVPEPPIQPKFIRQAEFAIPFAIEGLSAGSLRPLEVQLHVSADRGTYWQVADRVAADAKAFVFRAPHDGEFWFMVRTKYSARDLRPQKPPAPELIVVVDTAQPAVELQAEQGDAGEIRVRWRIQDANPRPDGLKMEYQSDGSDSWQRVALDSASVGRAILASGRRDIVASGGRQPPESPAAQPSTAPFSTGPSTAGPSPSATDHLPDPASIDWSEVAFVPLPPAGSINVRLEAVDLAGNRAVSQCTVAARSHSLDQSLDLRRRATVTRPANWPPQPTLNPPAEEVATPAADPPGMPATFPGRSGDLAAPDPSPRQPWKYPETETPQPVFQPAAGEADQSLLDERPLDGSPLDERPLDKRLLDEPGSDAFPPVEGMATPAPSQEPSHTLAQTETFQGELLPPGARPRMVNSTRFELEYELDSVGPSGVARIELWGTRDGGRTWTRFGIDDDNRSPMLVTVDGEGTYGFRMLVESGNGLRSAPPVNNDQPDVWVAVDLTRPSGQLIKAEQQSSQEHGDLVIGWEASDQLLAARPISLWFSGTAGGPWSTIAAGLENTGRYAWRIDHRVPDRIYLRLEVRDEAGNVRIVDTDQPISIDRIRPQGHIRSVRPLDDAARRSKWIYNLMR